jgi:8-oxo-dGTP pyrophosphatase MutT (NUDIX family)
VEPGELPGAALARELREELGIDIAAHRRQLCSWMQGVANARPQLRFPPTCCAAGRRPFRGSRTRTAARAMA